MTYIQAMIRADKTETWEDQGCFNNRGPILVFVVGKQRFRADTRKQTTLAELKATGFEKASETAIKGE